MYTHSYDLRHVSEAHVRTCVVPVRHQFISLCAQDFDIDCQDLNMKRREIRV